MHCRRVEIPRWAAVLLGFGLAVCLLASPGRAQARRAVPEGCVRSHGVVVRGPIKDRKIALVFTAHRYTRGYRVILETLKRHNLKASFFVTGYFARKKRFRHVLERIIREGHQVGPHSEYHLLYASWSGRRTLVRKKTFHHDLFANVARLQKLGVKYRRGALHWWVPPFEHYNTEVAGWANAVGWPMVSHSWGTLTNADYTRPRSKNYTTSGKIFRSVMKRVPDGKLSGYVLLMHVGVHHSRPDPFYKRFPELVGTLLRAKYKPVTVAELLASCK